MQDRDKGGGGSNRQKFEGVKASNFQGPLTLIPFHRDSVENPQFPSFRGPGPRVLQPAFHRVFWYLGSKGPNDCKSQIIEQSKQGNQGILQVCRKGCGAQITQTATQSPDLPQGPRNWPRIHKDPKKSLGKSARVYNGCGFFAYSWKLPAYNGTFLNLQLTILAFLLTVGTFLLTVLAFLLKLELLCLQWESASNKGLKGLQAKKLNCKRKSSNCT